MYILYIHMYHMCVDNHAIAKYNINVQVRCTLYIPDRNIKHSVTK